MKSTWSTNLCWPWNYPQKWAKNIQKEPKTSVFDSFLTESVISVNVHGSPSRVWTYDPPVNSRMLCRWAIEEYFGKFKLTNFRFVSSASAWPCCCLFGGNLYGCPAAELSRNIMWQRPILPAGHPTSTFGAAKLNFCVRNENRWTFALSSPQWLYNLYLKYRIYTSFFSWTLTTA